jgi:hypothetical protein
MDNAEDNQWKRPKNNNNKNKWINPLKEARAINGNV